MRQRHVSVLAACLMIAACDRPSAPAPEPTASPPDPAKLLVGDWEAQVPEKNGGHYAQLMTFRADESFEVLIPPVRGKEVRLKGTYQCASDGQLSMSMPGKEEALQGTAKASSANELQLEVSGKTILLSRLSAEQAKVLATKLEEERLKQQSAENLRQLRDALHGRPDPGNPAVPPDGKE
jgi:hypothetical protein